VSRYEESEHWLRRAESSIPLGSQTFSKSRTQYPVGISPLYALKAKGAQIWDLDGNKYIDYVSALACVTLGYGDRGIERAIKKQLSSGISMSLPGKLEAVVAEKLIGMIPSAEKVRFGKNGTDATSAAIRLSRAYTGRDHILVCGYHGWQDWYIASTTRDKGIPKSTGALTHKFNYNDIESLKKLAIEFEDKIAAVIIEPMNISWPSNDFLQNIREFCTQKGIVLVFDETITGFRFANGGAQELFGVIPDLSTFGKGMANGMPISAIVGKAEIMDEMENIFFSGTFGGELLSLAATDEVLNRYSKENIPQKLEEAGQDIITRLSALIEELNLSQVVSLSGHPSWSFLTWRDCPGISADALKTYFAQLMYENGLLILGTHNISLSHTFKIRNSTLDIYRLVLSEIAKSLVEGSILNKLKVEPLQPLFKVR
jgi:glutamate-1-semialdehyde aminotransferase